MKSEWKWLLDTPQGIEILRRLGKEYDRGYKEGLQGETRRWSGNSSVVLDMAHEAGYEAAEAVRP